MKYTQSGGRTATGPAAWFTGIVYIDNIRVPDEQARVGCAHVRFTPGARTAWHTHPRGQTLYVTDGIGYVGRRGAPPQEIRPGDVIYIAPNDDHWHNAPKTASWPTSPSKKPTRTARWSPGASTSSTTSTASSNDRASVRPPLSGRRGAIDGRILDTTLSPPGGRSQPPPVWCSTGALV